MSTLLFVGATLAQHVSVQHTSLQLSLKSPLMAQAHWKTTGVIKYQKPRPDFSFVVGVVYFQGCIYLANCEKAAHVKNRIYRDDFFAVMP